MYHAKWARPGDNAWHLRDTMPMQFMPQVVIQLHRSRSIGSKEAEEREASSV